jgi:hypothetical protein
MSFGHERLDVYHAATKTRSYHADVEIDSDTDSDSDPEGRGNAGSKEVRVC